MRSDVVATAVHGYPCGMRAVAEIVHEVRGHLAMIETRRPSPTPGEEEAMVVFVD